MTPSSPTPRQSIYDTELVPASMVDLGGEELLTLSPDGVMHQLGDQAGERCASPTWALLMP